MFFLIGELLGKLALRGKHPRPPIGPRHGIIPLRDLGPSKPGRLRAIAPLLATAAVPDHVRGHYSRGGERELGAAGKVWLQ